MSIFRRRRDDVLEPEPPPGPLSREDVARRVGPGGADLLPSVRFATRREPDAGIDIARSKLGGAPDLAQGTGWPLVADVGGERRPLQFVAQVDLAEASRAAPGSLGLPQSGLLSFFVDLGVEGEPSGSPLSPTIVFTEADVPMVRCSLRLVPLPTAQFAAVGAWSWPASAGAGASGFAAEYDDDLQRGAPERFTVTSARHQLGGHLDSDAGPEAVALLQIDSDPSLELGWGPDGQSRLVWTLPRPDFAAGNWSAASVTLQPPR